MGFCFPGKGKTGDLPPRPECTSQWHARMLQALPGLKTTLLIGQYAQKYYLSNKGRRNLTENVPHWQDYLPDFFPFPNPPFNGGWLKHNPWFHEEVLPTLREAINFKP